MHHFILLLTLTALTWPSLAWAGDPLGTAGPFRSTAWARCEAGVVAQFTGACDPPPVDPKTPSDRLSQAHVDRAIKLLSLGRGLQARAALDEAVRADARNITALKLRARTALPGNGNDHEADVNAGLVIDPLDADLMAMRANILHGRGDAGALFEANLAVWSSYRNADVLWIRARILLGNKKLQEAEDDLTRALAIEHDYLRARHLRAAVRLHLGRFGDAFEDANIAVNQRPWDSSMLHLRAMARSGLGDFQGQVADLTSVLGEPGAAPTTANPSIALFNGLYIQRAIALVRLGRPSEAILDIDTVSKFGGPRAILRMQRERHASAMSRLAYL